MSAGGYRNECKKVTYTTRRDAKLAAKIGGWARQRLSAYLCPSCGLFHLTSAGAAGKARIRSLNARHEDEGAA